MFTILERQYYIALSDKTLTYIRDVRKDLNLEARA